MTILLPQIASRLFGEPLMVDAGKLAAIMTGIGARIVGGGVVLPGVMPVDHVAHENGRPSESMGVVGGGFDRMLSRVEANYPGFKALDVVSSVAVIPIEGTLVHKGKWLGTNSGQTSYEATRTLVDRASRDPGVRGVVFEVDSYGGMVTGAFETAAAIHELGKIKPTLAIMTDAAYSAGYLMASAARQIVMPPGGGAGSIGVMAMHADFSRQLEKEGVALTLITAGARKAAGHPALPLDDEERELIQRRVDASYERFTATVGAYRGDRLPQAAARATEARTYVGEAAVAAGLVDGIADPVVAFREFVNRVS